ncbi:hypothetical protein [Serratia marcescens]|uniref:hypothetical protein n=1 Tax=Serratia marcescens TaxID=615 RepID=UPI001D24B7C4|nr:hypothetical protein [Serratia marcescens]CAE7299168.1 hypothetical protein AI2618V1_1895 [Serratia marcescens]CAE7299318.1 hypothetical protein AI2617V1_1888 [Serratia marcescens]CAH3648314.1 hypothetical protein AI2618V1_1895 [Serratia marcescens]CAH3945343.1 hypothetical protein AI2617V1_1888 [Serratia marcescens]
MILPQYEPRAGTIPAKNIYESSLKYQFNKLIYFCEKFNTLLAQPRENHYLEKDCYYHLDAIINNAASLAEYYLPCVIYSIIGTVLPKPIAPRFDGFRKNIDEKGYEHAKSKLFENYKISVLLKSKEEFKEEYKQLCNDVFDKSIKFLINGDYDVIFTLNNYIKHNAMHFSYAPRVITNSGNTKNLHYLRFESDQVFMLGKSTLKRLALEEFNKIKSENKEFYICEDKFIKTGRLGHILFLGNKNITYTKGNSSAGVTSESLLRLIYQLSRNILESMTESVKCTDITGFEEYAALIKKITELEHHS